MPALMERAAEQGLPAPPMDMTHFLGRETLITTKRPSGMMQWREKLFASMMRNAETAARFFASQPGGGAGRTDRVLTS